MTRSRDYNRTKTTKNIKLKAVDDQSGRKLTETTAICIFEEIISSVVLRPVKSAVLRWNN